MTISEVDLVLTSRSVRLPQDEPSLARITRGISVPGKLLGAQEAPWIVWLRVSRARVLAVHHLAKSIGGCVITGESALIFLGVQPWWDNPDVSYRADSGCRMRPRLPKAQLSTVCVPEASLRKLVAPPGFSEIHPIETGGVLLPSWGYL